MQKIRDWPAGSNRHPFYFVLGLNSRLSPYFGFRSLLSGASSGTGRCQRISRWMIQASRAKHFCVVNWIMFPQGTHVITPLFSTPKVLKFLKRKHFKLPYKPTFTLTLREFWDLGQVTLMRQHINWCILTQHMEYFKLSIFSKGFKEQNAQETTLYGFFRIIQLT